jgi:hypothetical protein
MSESPYPFIEVSLPARSSTASDHNLTGILKVDMNADALVGIYYADICRANGLQTGLLG